MTTDTNINYYRSLLNQRDKEIAGLKDQIELLENKVTYHKSVGKFFRRRAMKNSSLLTITALIFLLYIIITQ